MGLVLYAHLTDLTVGGKSPAALESSDSREPMQRYTKNTKYQQVSWQTGSLSYGHAWDEVVTDLGAMSKLLDNLDRPTC